MLRKLFPAAGVGCEYPDPVQDCVLEEELIAVPVFWTAYCVQTPVPSL